MTRIRVFYESRQMECCGTPFAVGGEVAWKLVRYDAGALRAGEGYGAEAWVENHGGPERATSGRVRAVDLVRREYLAHREPLAAAPSAPGGSPVVLRGTGRASRPAPGAPVLEPLDRCPRWFDGFEEEEQPPRRVPFRVRRAVGVLVDLEAAN
ncbi:DUF6578 domain-containing protein [Streptomyces sp. NPDC006193]|uniref:DUF6578 domain-containing protein n=1 Tax=Streptomyces sp. NPDC006193 TaxID=3155717 RepID=UPI0033A46A65